MTGFLGLHVFSRILLGFVFHRVLTLDNPLGRKAKPVGPPGKTPLIRVKSAHLKGAGVANVSRLTGVKDGLPMLENGESFSAANVIWCTGFYPGFSWIELPVFDEFGQPIHRRGVVEREPGLYFIGLHFLYAMSSPMIQGVARDAAYVADAIARRASSGAEPISYITPDANQGSRRHHDRSIAASVGRPSA